MADYHAGSRFPATGWLGFVYPHCWGCQTRVARSHQAFLQNRLLAHVKSSRISQPLPNFFTGDATAWNSLLAHRRNNLV
jgi:hypothetical protein